ncbi:MAG TPA: ASKHA domain-containing protein [Candidatus Limnocylindrales bacterium]|nr:ASKHA domain-containing protein [Candidatus Limnocylindrales bacterium]
MAVVAGPRVTFEPDGRVLVATAGQTLLDATFAAGVPLDSVCGGRGICERCRVVVTHGEVEADDARGGRVGGEVLACLTRIVGDVSIEIPEASRIEGEQILTGMERWDQLLSTPEDVDVAHLPREVSSAAERFADGPLAFALPLDLPPPTLEDCLSDAQRVARELQRQHGLRDVSVPVEVLRAAPVALREAGWNVSAVLARTSVGHELIDIRPGGGPTRAFGVAVDIGTTTVVAHLVDLANGQTLGAAAAVNRQVRFGDDVISRIIHAGEPGGLDQLRTAIVGEINVLVGSLARGHDIERDEIVAVACAGNTTMIHLFLGLPPAEIRREPYIPVATAPPTCHASQVGLRIHPRATVAVMPGVSGWVGGDITADVVACGMDRTPELSMLIDVGTNGETVIGNRDFLVCCACSAGPAFEGGGISAGMRAAGGAIQRVQITRAGALAYETVGSVKPRGICGSGLVDLLAELLRTGYMDRAGRLKPEAPMVREGPAGPEVLVAAAESTGIGRDITLGGADIENLLRAKGAVYAGAALLARRIGVSMSDIERIYVAGGFGAYLDIRKAMLIGLLPEVPLERVTFIGNGSVAGAKMGLLAKGTRRRAIEVARKMTYRELSVDPGFMEEYVSAMFFPHTDAARFPRACAELGFS